MAERRPRWHRKSRQEASFLPCSSAESTLPAKAFPAIPLRAQLEWFPAPFHVAVWPGSTTSVRVYALARYF